MKTTTISLLAMLLASACGKDEATTPDKGLSIKVAPLQLAGVTDVSYTLRVRAANGTLEWEKSGLTSSAFGDGSGALAFVGPCDAAATANPHSVELVIDSVSGADGPITIANPTVPTPLTRAATCLPNQDVAVEFNVTVMREADQGFFDIAVTFDDIFCSAKFDCIDDQQQPMNLLFKNGERARTVVLGFACTTGQADAGQDNTTWLHLTDMALECGSEGNKRHYAIDPSKGEGNVGGVTPVLFEVGEYRDEEQLEPYDKCFWNMAFGVNEGIDDAKSCVLVGQGTASNASWTPNAGFSPRDTIYPYIDWRVNLTNSAGAVMCQQHPLNAPMVAGTQVSTHYTDFGGAKFTHEWQCGADVVTTEKVSCSATVTGIGDASASFTQTPEGVSVAFGAELPSAIYKLPTQYGEVGECCFNPCCTE